MAVAFDGEAVRTVQLGATGGTITTKTTAGSDRVGVVCIAVHADTADITGITWNGVAMVEQADRADALQWGLRVWIWTLVAPATGSSSIVVTGTGITNGYAAASSYSGVHQTTPVRASAGATIASIGTNGPSSVTVSSATDDMVVDCLGMFGNQPSGPVSGQTSLYNAGNPGTNVGLAASYEAGASSVVSGWDYAAYGSQDWVGVSVSLQPPAGGGGGNPYYAYAQQ
jgi:hypothetical protein